MNFRNLTLASLFLYLVSLAATQTVYGGGLEAVRWISLFAYGIFGAISYIETDSRLPLGSLNISVAFYLGLWSLTVIFGKYPLFSSFRFLAHAMVVISCLVFLPQVVTLTNAPRMLTTLKILVAATLVISYLEPARRTVFDVEAEFRGIFGNSNSFGHICAIGSLLFLHGFVTKGRTWWGFMQAALMILAVSLMIRSGARSSAIALLTGVLVLSLNYRKVLSRNLLIVWCIGSALLLFGITMQSNINEFVNKHAGYNQIEQPLDRIGASRIPIWTASWEAFTERPIFGWGFGVDKDADMAEWNGQFTSLGFTRLDPVNDLTYTLETGGVIGAFAYWSLLSLIPRMWTTKQRMLPLFQCLCSADYKSVLAALESQQLFMSLTVAMTVMFELDGTALSAGSFFAVLLWVALGLCVGLRSLLVVDLPRRLLRAQRLHDHENDIDRYSFLVSEH